MTLALVDDQLLGRVLGDGRPDDLPADAAIFTTGYWYVRLCQAVFDQSRYPGVLSQPFLDLPDIMRARALEAVMQLPETIGLLSLRELGPLIGRLRRKHALNTLGIEALAASVRLSADVFLSAESPRLQAALAGEHRPVQVIRNN